MTTRRAPQTSTSTAAPRQHPRQHPQQHPQQQRRRRRLVGRVDDLFTRFADQVSEQVGKWWFSVVSLVILSAWTLYGALVIGPQVADWFSSPQWNFPLNTITTVGEWFLGAFIAAAANRVERRNREMQQAHTQLLNDIRRWVEREEREIEALAEQVAAEIDAVAVADDDDDEAPASGATSQSPDRPPATTVPGEGQQHHHGTTLDG